MGKQGTVSSSQLSDEFASTTSKAAHTPQYIIQDQVIRQSDILRSKGTDKAAVFENGSKCKGLIA